MWVLTLVKEMADCHGILYEAKWNRKVSSREARAWSAGGAKRS